MTDDAQLLRRFAEEQSQEAFAELVRRHLGWVFHAALRRTGGRHDLAQDVAQQVFAQLAKNASVLCRHERLAGWLHVATRFAANRALRAEARRRNYETTAHVMNDFDQTARDADWDQLRPALDDVMDRLPERDREMLLLRFFEGLAFGEIGATLRVSEDAARKRVDRALEKLRVSLKRRGIVSTASALGTLLAGRVSAAVGAELQATITTAALSVSAATGAPGFGLLYFMSATKTTLAGAGLLGLAAVLLLSSLGVAVHELRAAKAVEASVAATTQRYEADQRRLRELMRTRVEAGSRVAASPAPAAGPSATGADRWQDNRSGEKATRELAAGRAFLAAFPEARRMMADYIPIETARNYALSLHSTGLTPAQMEEFKRRTAQQEIDTLRVTPNSITSGAPVPEVDLRALFGEAGFARWQESHRPGAAQSWAKNLALAVNKAAQPLTLAQVMQLAQLAADHSPEFREGGPVFIDRVDWPRVLAQTKSLLSEEQWRAAQPYLLKQEVTRRAKALQNELR